ncbi:hypothetical protein H2201_003837 [Coniosporium apollinis]|uniref:Major facilitator superfamily (MFS) profile domain-containing protein n=1 Tax=Coniosporium apollinis TaxID=61459 RepID=A0ABQ9NZW3_9PEZI|nr:hypothetical protein H2201_003837 [Coniosporium apollinis]
MSIETKIDTLERKKHVDTEMLEVVGKEALPVDASWLRQEKKLVRKLDMTLMPMIWVLYMFNYLDRNNIAQARLNTFEEDLGLVGTDFNVAVSILNVGYTLMQLPSNMILTRVRPSLYMPFWVCVWSCISAATAGVHNYRGLVAVRFFLGIAEAPFFPGAFYLLSCWYIKKELALRTAILYSGLVLATAFSGLIAAGVFAGLDGAQERQVAIERIERDRVSNQETNRSVWYGLKLASKDFRVWVFPTDSTILPTIVRGFNLGSRTTTLLLTAPPYLLGAIISFIVAYSSDRFGERGYHIAVPMLVAVVGFAISVAILNVPARYFASFLYISGCFAANSLVYSWGASTTGQTPEKRACATAIINVMGQLGNIWSPYCFRSGDSPRYTLAMVLMMAFSILSAVLCAFMKGVLRRDNKKLVQRFEGTGTEPQLYTL